MYGNAPSNSFGLFCEKADSQRETKKSQLDIVKENLEQVVRNHYQAKHTALYDMFNAKTKANDDAKNRVLKSDTELIAITDACASFINKHKDDPMYSGATRYLRQVTMDDIQDTYNATDECKSYDLEHSLLRAEENKLMLRLSMVERMDTQSVTQLLKEYGITI